MADGGRAVSGPQHDGTEANVPDPVLAPPAASSSEQAAAPAPAPRFRVGDRVEVTRPGYFYGTTVQPAVVTRCVCFGPVPDSNGADNTEDQFDKACWRYEVRMDDGGTVRFAVDDKGIPIFADDSGVAEENLTLIDRGNHCGGSTKVSPHTTPGRSPTKATGGRHDRPGPRSVVHPLSQAARLHPLEEQPWFRPFWTVESAAEFLARQGVHGAFVVRRAPNTGGDYALSIHTPKGPLHSMLMRRLVDGRDLFHLYPTQQWFHSLFDLVQFAHDTPLSFSSLGLKQVYLDAEATKAAHKQQLVALQDCFEAGLEDLLGDMHEMEEAIAEDQIAEDDQSKIRLALTRRAWDLLDRLEAVVVERREELTKCRERSDVLCRAVDSFPTLGTASTVAASVQQLMSDVEIALARLGKDTSRGSAAHVDFKAQLERLEGEFRRITQKMRSETGGRTVELAQAASDLAVAQAGAATSLETGQPFDVVGIEAVGRRLRRLNYLRDRHMSDYVARRAIAQHIRELLASLSRQFAAERGLPPQPQHQQQQTHMHGELPATPGSDGAVSAATTASVTPAASVSPSLSSATGSPAGTKPSVASTIALLHNNLDQAEALVTTAHPQLLTSLRTLSAVEQRLDTAAAATRTGQTDLSSHQRQLSATVSRVIPERTARYSAAKRRLVACSSLLSKVRAKLVPGSPEDQEGQRLAGSIEHLHAAHSAEALLVETTAERIPALMHEAEQLAAAARDCADHSRSSLTSANQWLARGRVEVGSTGKLSDATVAQGDTLVAEVERRVVSLERTRNECREELASAEEQLAQLPNGTSTSELRKHVEALASTAGIAVEVEFDSAASNTSSVQDTPSDSALPPLLTRRQSSTDIDPIVRAALSPTFSALFDQLDINRDGRLSSRELVLALRGRSDLDDLFQLPPHGVGGRARRIQQQFTEMDEDHDRSLSRAEFIDSLIRLRHRALDIDQ
eukprot:m.228072 g.228072  ORF g.228072 m.228072 type:complete len:966 (+) comp18824_c0_seq4:2289-5186(+)